MRFKDVKQMRESTLKRFLRRETFMTELEQHRLDCLASHGDLGNWRFLKKKLRTLTKEDIRPAPLLNGRDLLAMGMKEGPAIGRFLKEAEEAQLERRITNREEALAWARRRSDGENQAGKEKA